ncbi:MAG: hypothetical protein HYT03_00125 [Candidatus Harrisonbacteria bacterium]|nr:hypothetical protein [Candidatus Harrisonbacteria bacterium]
MKKFLKVLLILFLITIYNLPITNVALAQQSRFIPCEASLPPDGKVGGGCDIHDFIVFLKNIINFTFYVAIPLAVIFIVWGAFVIMTAGGSETRFGKGKSIITAAVIGLAILFGSWLIVTVVVRFLETGTVQ